MTEVRPKVAPSAPWTWVDDALVMGAAIVAAVAADVALRIHAGASSVTADIGAAVVFATLVAAHVATRLGPPRSEKIAKPTKPSASRRGTSRAAMAVPTPVETAQASEGPTQRAGLDFDNLQRLVAELARTTPGPKATTGDPDAPAARPTAPRAVAPVEPRRVNAVMDALSNQRLNVYVEPIQALAGERPRHYEVSVRLMGSDGAELAPDDVVAVARSQGLQPRLDALVLPRAARIAQHFRARGQAAQILSAVNGSSLPDPDFRNDVTAATIAADGADLVLSFAQNDVVGFGPIHWEILSTLSEMGLRFGIEGVTHLDMDFAGLSRRGFAFAKLDAAVLLDGLPEGTHMIPAADICRHFATAGLGLIVGHIDDETVLAKLLGFGVLFGQGTLFGGPRAVRADLLSMSHSAAA